MAASTLAELEQAIRQELLAAMQEAGEKMFDDLQGEVIGYYTGNPKKYVRTHKLLDTPRLDPISASGNTITFKVRLDKGGGYTTGSNPSMETVLNWTNYGLAGTIGSHGYWERAEKKMESTFNSVMRSHFG